MKMFLIGMLLLLATGCSVITGIKETSGYVVDIRDQSSGNVQILVAESKPDGEVADLTDRERIEHAKENNGAYYTFSPDEVDEIQVGDRVRLKYDSTMVAESNPPQMAGEELERIGE